ncbi:alginate O-acetyltransferase [Pseudomonas typographi]|uniref:Probable alginate O-acetylase AlgJ n=1 Tax=Pseudomonas typographi TaxID=2715964 RepID=A0ABR7YYM8_9PSED|nr:alginate O-acetyltransferase [Pseudomonas typographi]MBD1550815.1 alginate O-acetyltransferase [Pseudomonas typographi]MBD1587757.1 alginate O-acetyltransferase [Pseudomonas typographi]MBD1598280.1 alginate O-acetyltransferase [Pseudomonas typographi]
MTRTLRLLYVLTFFGILVALGLWSLVSFGSFSKTEQMTVLNGKFTHALEGHYDDEFPIKRLGTNLWAAVDYKLFKEGRPGVVLGRDQWLYTDEEFNPVAHGDRVEADNVALVRAVAKRLKTHNIKLVMAVVPAKARVYPEHIGDDKPAALHADLYQQLHSQLQQAGIAAPDLLAPLEQGKQQGQVFLRTDTHWTPMGADLVAKQLGSYIQAQAPLTTDPVQYVTEAGPVQPYKGDLTTFLPLDPLFTNLLPKPDDLSQHTTKPANDGGEGGDALFADSTVPVALVGTSYSANPHWNFLGALQEALHSDVVNYAEDGHGPFPPMLKFLQSDAFKANPPQVVIWEFPERYLPMNADLSAFDAKWLAELKNAQDNTQNLAVGQTN